MNRKIIISINTAWNIYNFRAGLIRALVQQGYQVVALAPSDDYANRLHALGCDFIHLPMDSNGTNPGRDLSLLCRYFRILRAERPLAYLGYTVKPNVYGSIAAHLLHIPVINNIAGLGTTFINNTFLTRIVRILYRVSLQRSGRIFFQNADDQKLFIESRLVHPDRTDRLPGSGMDLSRYQPAPPAQTEEGPFVFLLVSRMLKDKGIEEFAGAARIVRQRFSNVEFRLLGFVDSTNPNSIPLERIRAWEEAGTVRYLGKTDDVRPYLSASDCVVLPSYREGIPRSLLEAAAMSRPIVTTDTVGCRDVVDDNINGLLCKVQDTLDLAEKMKQMLCMSPEERLEMGRAGRRKVESQFDEKLVIQKYLSAINELADAEPSAGDRNRRLIPVPARETQKP